MGRSAPSSITAECPRSATALVGGIVTQDFRAVRASLAADVQLRALLPGGLREWAGADIVADRFEQWFGNTERFAAVESGAGEVGWRTHLRWRLRLQAQRLGPGWFVVEQVAYCGANDREISRLDLLCTGYLAERSDG